MKSSLTEIERADIEGKMLTLIMAQSKLVRDNPDYFTNALLKIMLNKCLLFICDYIHRPDRYVLNNPTIQYIWADMCIDVLKKQYSADNPDDNSASSEAETPGLVTQFKMGNATVHYGSDSSAAQASKAENADDIMRNYTRRLQEYRVIV